MTSIPVICLDGPSGSGKGTIARKVAAALGWHLLDSGALYRIVGLAASRRGLPLDAEEQIAALAVGLDIRFTTSPDGGEQILLEGEDITGQIRTEDTGRLASAVASLPAVRDGPPGAAAVLPARPGTGG